MKRHRWDMKLRGRQWVNVCKRCGAASKTMTRSPRRPTWAPGSRRVHYTVYRAAGSREWTEKNPECPGEKPPKARKPA